jgi:uncharacterized protein (UPF0332 family)
MRWDEFLHTANRLAGGPTEGDWRSAISRGYYAVFHFFREFLLTLGVDVGQGAACHSNLYIGLNNCGVAAVAVIAGRIDALRSNRASADYELRHRVDQRRALAAAQQAAEIVADFQASLAAVPAARIAAGARRHLQSIGRIP